MPQVELRRRIPRWATKFQRPARYKGASGGRASGKSHFFAEEAVEAMVRDPNLRFVCIREVQRSLTFSAKSLIESKIKLLGVSELFEVLQTQIRRIGGTGVMIFEGLQDHTADSIKSLEGFGRAWVEEAQSISQRSLDLLIPTIRADNSEIWFSWNPDQQTDPVDAFFARKPTGSVREHVTYLDNPFCPKVMLDEAARVKAEDEDAYEHIWKGGYFLGGNGRVYSSFINKPYPIGNIDESIEDLGGVLLVGMDFNVNPMSAVLATRAADECLVHDAIAIMTSNTDEMAAEIRRRFPLPRHIVVCPDPSGKQRRSSAPVGQTDFTILESYGFEVRAPAAAPLVVDRINNAQRMFAFEGRRRTRVHSRATALITARANLVYKEGTSQPDKKSGFDHMCDAHDYLLWQEFNVLEQQPLVTIGSYDPY
ncbi:MAG TPA: PBSX family phage terminase large subunit [Gemmatimonadaceae bacterium]|jgi:phage terminase large subunit